MKSIIYLNGKGKEIADRLVGEFKDAAVLDYKETEMSSLWNNDGIIFIGALGICVRMIAPFVQDKHSDPAVVCIDSLGKNVISVLSGHIGGANDLCREIAAILGANPVITTQSDNVNYWQLDTIAEKFNWVIDYKKNDLNKVISSLLNGDSVGLVMDIRDAGTEMMERTLPPNVRLIKSGEDMKDFKAMIIISPFLYEVEMPVIFYRPGILNLGFGCRKNCNPEGIPEYIEKFLINKGISPLSVKSLSTIDLKKDEDIIRILSSWKNIREINIYSAEDLTDIEIPNPSEKVLEVTGIPGVAESCALKSSEKGKLILEKQKGRINEESDFTFALALDRKAIRGGHIEIVGAGPGDPELVSVRGKHFLQMADLILYAGSLVPRELTYYAKPGCTVKSSASMNLDEQFALMKEFYDKDKLIVRLHTGDPCIYGAIQEQMALFDQYGMSYHITPGISAFQAAAAELQSQFTIPEKVQTIILTRGEGRTPMPEKEQLHKLAKSQSTMCIYLSAGIVDEVQKELLMEYPEDTPVAVCYKLTWKEQKIYRGILKDLASIVHNNNLSLTTLLVIGDAIGNRNGLSRLYDRDFTHLFRK